MQPGPAFWPPSPGADWSSPRRPAKYAAMASDRTMNNEEDLYPCVGICMADPDSGYCLGCGRPPLASPAIVAEISQPVVAPSQTSSDPDSPA